MIKQITKVQVVKRLLFAKMNDLIKQVPLRENKYIHNNKFENSIKIGLQNPTCGVIVETLDDSVRNSDSLMDWIKLKWNIDSNKVKNTKLSSLIYKQDKPVAIILDDFDYAMEFKNISESITSMAEDSSLTQHYIICINLNGTVKW